MHEIWDFIVHNLFNNILMSKSNQSKGETTPFEEFLLKPYLSTWIGSWLIFFGVTILLLSSLFLHNHLVRTDWTSFWGMIVVGLGGSMFSISTFVNSSILISFGGVFLTIGLLLYSAYLAWQLNDDLNIRDDYKERVTERAILGIVAMLTVLIGIGFFVRKSIQRFVKPYFGPNNYMLYGSLTFGSGALSIFFYNISLLKHVEHHVYHPLNNSVKFGGYLFSIGAWYLLLSSSRSYYCKDLLFIPNYPSFIKLQLHSYYAFYLSITSSIMSIGGLLLVIGRVLSFDSGRIQVISSASALVAYGYISISLVLIFKKKTEYVLSFSYFLLSFAMIVYSLGHGLELSLHMDPNSGRFKYPSDFQTGAMFIGILGSIISLVNLFPYISLTEILVDGNYHFLAHIFGFSGYLCITLMRLSVSLQYTVNCAVACRGTEEFGYMFISLSTYMLFGYFILSLDLSTILQYKSIKSEDDYILLSLDKYFHNIFVYLLNLTDDDDSSINYTMNDRIQRIFDDKDYINAVNPEFENEFNAINNVLNVDVFIVGCGPTGLTLANELGIRDVKTHIIDSREAVNRDSRFFSMASTTVEGLKRIGVLDKIKERAIPQTFGHGTVALTGMTQQNAKVLASSLGPSREIQQKLGHNLSTTISSQVHGSRWGEEMPQRCMQSVQELCLKEQAEENSNISVNYGFDLIDFYQNNDAVHIKVQNNQTKEFQFIKSKYLVGCDGPGSLVSQKLGVKFDGFVNLGQTRTIHIHAPGLLARMQSFAGDALQYHVALPGFGVALFVPNDLKNEAWTFFLMGLTDGRMPRQLTKEDMYEVIQNFLGPNITFSIISDGSWFWNLFFARRFVYNRVLICGDASHSWPPFGGMGGNTCYGDANNLGWKLSSVVAGWGSQGMLDSYNFERRQFGLRMIMTVLNWTPDRSQILRLAKIVQYPWLTWTATYRWLFAARGAHSGNHMMSEGILYGTKYVSNINYHNDKYQSIEPVECPPCLYNPRVIVGGKIPHIRLVDGSSTFDLISKVGYTLFVMDDENINRLTVEDVIVSLSAYSTNQSSKNVFIGELSMYFSLKKIPLTIVHMKNILDQLTDPIEISLRNLYYNNYCILIRPDFYVTWYINNNITKISTFELQKVSLISSGEIYSDDTIKQSNNTSKYLSNKFISNIQGYRHLHPTAIYIENEDKSKVIKKLAEKISKKEPEVSLTTKAKVYTEIPQTDNKVYNDNIEDKLENQVDVVIIPNEVNN